MCSRFHKKPEAVQTVKLTLYYRPKSKSATYVQLFVHRIDQTAHISLQILSISKSEETKTTECALTYRRAPPHSSLIVVLRLVAVWPVWRPVERLSAAGEGVFTDWAGGLQGLF